MPYVHCMPARVSEMNHALDNIVSGVLETPKGPLNFKTRGHIVKATNKIYTACAWKPRKDAYVLIDGQVDGEDILVDHIEDDLFQSLGLEPALNVHLDIIAKMLPKHPPATATMRVWRAGGDHYRIRFAHPASRKEGRGSVLDEIVHAAYSSDGQWYLWSIAKIGGAVVAKGIDGPLLPILARASGSDLLSGETEREREKRRNDEERLKIEADRQKVQEEAPAFDDCPF